MRTTWGDVWRYARADRARMWRLALIAACVAGTIAMIIATAVTA